MKRAAIAALLVGLVATPAFAQGRGKNKQGVPPGHLPPDGMCRVWYDGVPPGHQPRATSCGEAERIASRDPRARVLYGGRSKSKGPVYRDEREYPGGARRDDDDSRRPGSQGRRPNRTAENRGRAVPRDQYPDSSRYPEERNPRGREGYRYESDAFRSGYDDGVVKGREDAEDGDRFDPARHGWYRSGDRGYDRRFGSREEYRAEYRRGFLAGYQSAHR